MRTYCDHRYLRTPRPMFTVNVGLAIAARLETLLEASSFVPHSTQPNRKESLFINENITAKHYFWHVINDLETYKVI